VLQGVGRSRVAAPSYWVRADSGLAPFPRTWHNRAGPASRSRPLVRRHLLCRPLADVLGRPLRSSPAASPPGNSRHVLRVRALVVSSRSAAAWAASAAAGLVAVEGRRHRLHPLGPDRHQVAPRRLPATCQSVPWSSSRRCSGSVGSAGTPTPSWALILSSMSRASSGLSRRKLRAFSRPCPSWSPS